MFCVLDFLGGNRVWRYLYKKISVMNIKVDASGLDEFIEEIENEVSTAMINAAHSAVDTQKTSNISNKKTYQNHTWNLRNAPGAVVFRNGKIVDMYVPADGAHGEAKEQTESMLIYGNHPQDGVVFADGMHYASFVSAKGFDVDDSARIKLSEELSKVFMKE